MAKKHNRKHSKIDTLPETLKEAVDQMLLSGETYKVVANFVKDNAGMEISQSAVWRYANNLSATVSELRMVNENMRVMVEEMAKYPDLDTTSGIARLLSHRVLTAIQGMDEEALKNADPLKLIQQSTALIKAVSYKQDMDTKLKDIKDVAYDTFKEDIFDAMAKENPQLYSEMLKFIKAKQNEGDAE